MKHFLQILLFTIMLFSVEQATAQLFISNSGELYVSESDTLYSRSSVQVEGALTLNNNTAFVIDGDLINDGEMRFTDGTNKALFHIGSGNANSNAAQDLQFSTTESDSIPYIILNKISNTASISRGHVALLEQFKVESGNFDANSSIVDTPEVNTVSGLTFISPNESLTAVVEESIPGSISDVLVERYVPASNRAFRFLSSSVTTNGTISENLQEGGQVTTVGGVSNPRPGYGTHITGATSATGGFDVTNSGFASLYYWNNGSQTYSQSSGTTSESFSAGQPYSIFLRGDRSIDLTNDYVKGSTTLRTLGDMHIGDFSVSGLSSGIEDFNLIGNPYQAQVNIKSLLEANTTTGLNSNFIYLYDPSLSNNGVFVTVDISEETPSVVPATSEADEYLQPNKSFFIVTTAANPTMTFKEEFKKDQDQTVTTGVYSSNTNLAININLNNDDTNDLSDAVCVKYGDNFTNAVNDEDAIKLWNSSENLAIFNANEYLSVDKRDSNLDTDNTLLYITNYSDLNYHLDISVENIFNVDELFLIDHYLTTQTPLSEGQNLYNFNIDESIPTSFDPYRFEIGVINTLGSNDRDNFNIGIYPNPVDKFFTIEMLQTNDRILGVQVFSIDGKLVKNLEVEDFSNSINVFVESLQGGVYVVEVTTENTKHIQKIIKE